MKRTTGYLFVLVLMLFISNCSSSSKVSSTAEKSVESKLLALPEGKAMVYFVRPSFIGTAINFKVYCDGDFIGMTRGGHFIYISVEPGKHTFLSQAENKEELQIVVEADKNYFIEQIPQMGAIKARNKLVVLNDMEGKTKLDKCKLPKDFVAK